MENKMSVKEHKLNLMFNIMVSKLEDTEIANEIGTECTNTLIEDLLVSSQEFEDLQKEVLHQFEKFKELKSATIDFLNEIYSTHNTKQHFGCYLQDELTSLIFDVNDGIFIFRFFHSKIRLEYFGNWDFHRKFSEYSLENIKTFVKFSLNLTNK